MMMDEQREQYQKAAELLLKHRPIPPDVPTKHEEIADKAWAACYKVGLSTREVDDRAARLLCECIEKGEVLR